MTGKGPPETQFGRPLFKIGKILAQFCKTWLTLGG